MKTFIIIILFLSLAIMGILTLGITNVVEKALYEEAIENHLIYFQGEYYWDTKKLKEKYGIYDSFEDIKF